MLYNIHMEARTQKRLFIGLVFILILSGIGYGIYAGLATKFSCTDGIMNGKEEGLDCGILACGKSCEPAIMPISIISSQFLKVGQADYDFVAQLFNPNTSYGASRVEYGLGSNSGSFYILPGQTKWLVLTALKIVGEVGNAKLIIKNAQWEKIDVPVILFDDTDKIVGVGKTDIRTFIAKSERGFKVAWPFQLSGNVVRQDVEALTNLFENSNFIKSYGSQEKFQKFY